MFVIKHIIRHLEKSFIIEKKKKKGERIEQCFLIANLRQLVFFFIISIIVPITEIFKGLA